MKEKKRKKKIYSYHTTLEHHYIVGNKVFLHQRINYVTRLGAQ